MPRWLLFLLFLTFGLLVLGSVHYYLYRRLVVAAELPPPWRTVGMVVVVVLVLCFPLSFVIGRVLDISHGRFLLYPIYIWLGTMMMLFFVLVGIDLVRLVVWLTSWATGHGAEMLDPGRRVFMGRLIAGATAGTVGVAAAIAVWRGLGQVTVKPIEIILPHLPAAFDGFRIVQLTDLHLGAMRQGAWLRQVVDRTNGLAPDLIAITGDLADATPGQLTSEMAMLGELRAPHGQFFVTGNHEYFIDLDGWLNGIAEIGIRVLRNERVEIHRGDAVIDLAGVDDHDGARMAPGHGPDVARAMAGHDPQRASVLLAHQPRIIDAAADHGVGLVLAGHTHGGQIWPWGYLVYLQQPYVRGLHERRGTQIYISEGTGFWGPPMRLGSTSEITLVTLRAPR